MKKIKALIPAEGWLAVMFAKEDPYYYLSRIACFAAIGGREKGGDCGSRDYSVSAYLCNEDYGLDEVELCTNFHCLTHEFDITDEVRNDWSKKGKVWADLR